MQNSPSPLASAEPPNPTVNSSTYIGRFAPSPTGPLHFGSLVAALASYLHAQSQQGQWLVRMEDLDPPREQAGAADDILRALENHGLHWDGELMYQRQRHEAYQCALDQLNDKGLIYACDCSRQDLQAMGGIYSGHCRERAVDLRSPHALRLKLCGDTDEILSFNDLFQGPQQQNLRTEAGDPIVRRKDNFFAYQLAVVVDDIAQHISHVVRGMDLLEVTARQIALFQRLNAAPPLFGHVPLALTASGQKLSKQNLAPPLESAQAGNNLWRALVFLGQNPPTELSRAAVSDNLVWGKAHWDNAKLARVKSHREF